MKKLISYETKATISGTVGLLGPAVFFTMATGDFHPALIALFIICALGSLIFGLSGMMIFMDKEAHK